MSAQEDEKATFEAHLAEYMQLGEKCSRLRERLKQQLAAVGIEWEGEPASLDPETLIRVRAELAQNPTP
ncbi:MAG: hypothetical protein H0U98_08880 [Alphaproteobacteria bacterium]|nr:hypothetical protein [Alphaproteobacteria bacterium]